MRQDQYSVSVSLVTKDRTTKEDRTTGLGVWDKLEGGEIDSEETKYRPGAMAVQVSLGGSQNVGNVTVSRLYDLNRDHIQVDALIQAVGKGTVTVTKQALDVNGDPYGARIVYVGMLKAVTLPDVDSESSDAALIELEVATGGTVAVNS
jgi:hypothetical protein